MNILGFSEGFHDAAVTVLSDGHISFASQSERYSRKKNDKFIDINLKQYVDNNFKIDKISFYEKDLLKRARQFYSGQYKKALFGKRTYTWKPNKSFLHHKSHVAAAFQCSPYDDAIGIVIDAIGEFDTITIWECWYENGLAKYKKLFSKKYPNSLGLFYSSVTQACGLKPNEDEYITMGMSGYGKFNHDLFKELQQERLLNLHKGLYGDYNNYSPEDLAYNSQKILEDELRRIIHPYKFRNIVYGGGVALNCLANGRLLKDTNNFIFPNPGDAGSSLGCAALMWGKKVHFQHMYLGHPVPLLSDNQIKDIVDLLERGEILGVCSGNAEFGPRALGNRSLIADPRTLEMKDKVNQIKKRQEFRPFAPSCLSEYVNEHFDISTKGNYEFMQHVVECKNDKFKATTHVDNTARLHVVRPSNLHVSSFRKLLECWYQRTGCPVLLNTSLNIKGQPIVNNKQDALDFQNHYGVKVFYGAG